MSQSYIVSSELIGVSLIKNWWVISELELVNVSVNHG